MVVAGNDKGKTGKVLEVLYKKSRVLVEDVAMVSKHQKPDAKNPDGGIVKKEAAIHISNVMLFDAKAKSGTRVKHELQNGKKVRVSVKTGELFN